MDFGGRRAAGGRRAITPALAALALLASGCRGIPLSGNVRTDANVSAGFQGSVDVRLPTNPDPGPMVPIVVRGGAGGAQSPRVAMIDVDGLLVNQNLTGLYS